MPRLELHNTSTSFGIIFLSFLEISVTRHFNSYCNCFLFEKIGYPYFFFFVLFGSRFFAIKFEHFRFCPWSRSNGGWNVGMGVPQYNWNAAMGMHNNGWGGAGNMPHRWPPGYRVSDRWIRLRIRILFKLILAFWIRIKVLRLLSNLKKVWHFSYDERFSISLR